MNFLILMMMKLVKFYFLKNPYQKAINQDQYQMLNIFINPDYAIGKFQSKQTYYKI